MSVLRKLENFVNVTASTGIPESELSFCHKYGCLNLSNEEVAQLSEELLAMVGLGWQPIKSAPLDGTKVDLWLVDHNGEAWRQTDAWYVKGEIYSVRGGVPDLRDGWFAEKMDYEEPWFCDHPEYTRPNGDVEFIRATHWRSIPQAPQVKP